MHPQFHLAFSNCPRLTLHTSYFKLWSPLQQCGSLERSHWVNSEEYVMAEQPPLAPRALLKSPMMLVPIKGCKNSYGTPAQGRISRPRCFICQLLQQYHKKQGAKLHWKEYLTVSFSHCSGNGHAFQCLCSNLHVITHNAFSFNAIRSWQSL